MLGLTVSSLQPPFWLLFRECIPTLKAFGYKNMPTLKPYLAIENIVQRLKYLPMNLEVCNMLLNRKDEKLFRSHSSLDHDVKQSQRAPGRGWNVCNGILPECASTNKNRWKDIQNENIFGDRAPLKRSECVSVFPTGLLNIIWSD